MFDQTPKRFDRIVAILIQLQSKKIVRAHEMAERFEVSLRTIYRDIRTLEASGVPIYSEAGIGYSLMDGYRLPPVMFTREEVASFIAAEKLMQQFTDRELGGHHASAMFKLKALLRSSEKDLVSDMESNVLVRNAGALFHNKAPNALAAIFRSVGEKMQALLLYEAIAASAPTERIVEPVGVFHENRNWYVFAYCHLRNDYRKFRADRIHDIKSISIPFAKKHEPLETYLQNEQNGSSHKVRILVDPHVAKYLKFDRMAQGFRSEVQTPNGVEMIFESQDIENGFARWFLGFGDCASILEPESLRLRVGELLETALSRLKK